MIQIGDEIVHYEGYERQTRLATQEDVDKEIQANKETQIQAINEELAELDTVVSREYEDTYASFEVLRTQGIITTNPLYWNSKKQETVDRKAELRQQLKSL
jgi:hypothetical protein